MSPPGLVVDHVAHFVPDLDAAAQALEALGFTLTPRSDQRMRAQDGTLVPAGAANRCVMLEHGYLEFLTPGEGATPIATQLRDAIASRVGVHLLAFGTAAIARDQARLAAAGFAPQPPVALERTIGTETGSGTARFTVLRVPPGTMAEGRIQFVHHHTPELVWQKRWLSHANGAQALARVLIAADDPAAAAARYAAFTGLPVAAGAMIATRGGPWFLTPRMMREHFGFLPPPPPAIAGYVLSCYDTAAIAARVRAIGLPWHAIDSGIAIAAPPAIGGIVVFSGPPALEPS